MSMIRTIASLIVAFTASGIYAPGADAQQRAPGAGTQKAPAQSSTCGIKQGLILRDAQRSKILPITLVYPTGAGKFPVIVFSHGATGLPRGYLHLAQYWA